MNIQLYVMAGGAVVADQSVFLPSAPKGTSLPTPVPMYLLKHPRGNVLVDTGIDPEAFADPDGRWGGLARAFRPEGQAENGVVAQLRSLGLAPADVPVVVNTHLHMDHAGGNRFFPHARFYVQRAEMETAGDPGNEGKGYFRRDWDHPLAYEVLEGDHDLFGDGTILLKFLPGHTPGTQIVVVRTEGRALVLAGDVCPLEEVLHATQYPRNTWNAARLAESMVWLQEQERAGARIIFGHDPEQWAATLAEFGPPGR